MRDEADQFLISDCLSLSCDSNESFSSSSSDLADEASSASPEDGSPKRNDPEMDSNGSLFEFSSLMANLPLLRRGLSKYYRGKSQSFTCIAQAKCIEDLAKKETSYTRRIKASKSYAGGLERQNFILGSYNRRIAKKPSRGTSCASLISRRNSNGFLFGGKPPPVPVPVPVHVTVPVHRNL